MNDNIKDTQFVENEDDIASEVRIKKPNTTTNSRASSKLPSHHFAKNIKESNDKNSSSFWKTVEFSKNLPKQQSLQKLVPRAEVSNIVENDFTFEDQEKQAPPSPHKAYNLVENKGESQNSTDVGKAKTKNNSDQHLNQTPKENVNNDEPKSPVWFTEAVKLSNTCKLSFSLNENFMFDAADSSDEEPVPEERPNDLVLEDSINLDTVRGEVEIYDKENSNIKWKDNSFTKSEKKKYFTIKTATESSRMITLPNNNEHVNISDMLSRSFAVDDKSERYDDNLKDSECLNQSLNLISFVPESLTKNYSMGNLYLDFSNKYNQNL